MKVLNVCSISLCSLALAYCGNAHTPEANGSLSREDSLSLPCSTPPKLHETEEVQLTHPILTLEKRYELGIDGEHTGTLTLDVAKDQRRNLVMASPNKQSKGRIAQAVDTDETRHASLEIKNCQGDDAIKLLAHSDIGESTRFQVLDGNDEIFASSSTRKGGTIIEFTTPAGEEVASFRLHSNTWTLKFTNATKPMERIALLYVPFLRMR